MQEENDIDRLFRNGLHDPEIPFNETDWENMERKLDKREKKRVIPIWFITAGSIAAALVIGLFWIFMVQAPADQQSVVHNAAKKQDSSKNAGSDRILYKDSLFKGRPAGEVLSKDNQYVLKNNQDIPNNNGGDLQQELFQLPVPLNQEQIAKNNKKIDEVKIVGNTGRSNSVKASSSMPDETDSSILARKANALANSVDPLRLSDQAEIARTVKKKMEETFEKQQDLILSAMAAPDISTTKSSKPSKLSSNFGMLATYALGKKISVTSGVVYAKKIYNSGGTTPGGYSGEGTAWEVKANCDVIDVPVNINYKLFNLKRMSVSVNTGLSSYFMLKERYEFISGQAGAQQQVSNLEITNQNKHLFGIANVSVTFDHKISQTVSIGLQPFAKLPLTGIGNGDVNLKSAGLSFSLNIGLFPAKKTGKYAALSLR